MRLLALTPSCLFQRYVSLRNEIGQSSRSSLSSISMETLQGIQTCQKIHLQNNGTEPGELYHFLARSISLPRATRQLFQETYCSLPTHPSSQGSVACRCNLKGVDFLSFPM